MIIHMSAGTQSLVNEKMEKLAAVMIYSFPSLGVQHLQGWDTSSPFWGHVDRRCVSTQLMDPNLRQGTDKCVQKYQAGTIALKAALASVEMEILSPF